MLNENYQYTQPVQPPPQYEQYPPYQQYQQYPPYPQYPQYQPQQPKKPKDFGWLFVGLSSAIVMFFIPWIYSSIVSVLDNSNIDFYVRVYLPGIINNVIVLLVVFAFSFAFKGIKKKANYIATIF